MRISTKTGDKGYTSVLSGDRVPKDHFIIEYIGTLDELQSILGCLHHKDIPVIQKDIYRLMSMKGVEPWFDTSIEPQREFILPRGLWHVARTVCRRAERRGVTAGIDIIYLNRLSDYLYKLSLNNNNMKNNKECNCGCGFCCND